MAKPLVIQALDDWRDKLQAQEAVQLREMTRAWLQVEDRLRSQMQDLALYLDEQRAAGVTITQARLMQMERYQALIAQARAEHIRYAQMEAGRISANQRTALGNGIEMAQDTINATARDARIRHLDFTQINADAVKFMVGYARDGTPLNDLLRLSYPDTVITLTDELVKGLASGEGPRKTARIMADSMGGNLDRAMTIARTEQLRALRTANLQQMQDSQVVSGYIRRAQRSGNVCSACLSLDGQEYDTQEEAEFESHPNCACYPQPKLTVGDTPAFPSGPEWFDTLDEAQQRDMLGAGRFKLYQSGDLDWGKVAIIHDDPTWGATIKQATLADLGGE